MDEAMDRKVLSEILREVELDPAVLEKIGFAGRAFHIFRAFDVVPFGNCEFEDYFLPCVPGGKPLRLWQRNRGRRRL